METLVKNPNLLILEQNKTLTERELTSLGVHPTNLDAFSYQNYVLYQKGNKRIILQPLPANQFKVVRIYDFVSA
jgi:hypothetical protein